MDPSDHIFFGQHNGEQARTNIPLGGAFYNYHCVHTSLEEHSFTFNFKGPPFYGL